MAARDVGRRSCRMRAPDGSSDSGRRGGRATAVKAGVEFAQRYPYRIWISWFQHWNSNSQERDACRSSGPLSMKTQIYAKRAARRPLFSLLLLTTANPKLD